MHYLFPENSWLNIKYSSAKDLIYPEHQIQQITLLCEGEKAFCNWALTKKKVEKAGEDTTPDIFHLLYAYLKDCPDS